MASAGIQHGAACVAHLMRLGENVEEVREMTAPEFSQLTRDVFVGVNEALLATELAMCDIMTLGPPMCRPSDLDEVSLGMSLLEDARPAYLALCRAVASWLQQAASTQELYHLAWQGRFHRSVRITLHGHWQDAVEQAMGWDAEGWSALKAQVDGAHRSTKSKKRKAAADESSEWCFALALLEPGLLVLAEEAEPWLVVRPEDKNATEVSTRDASAIEQWLVTTAYLTLRKFLSAASEERRVDAAPQESAEAEETA